MGNSAVAVKGIEALCCNSLEGEGQEDMISPDLAQALFMHEVPVHVNATMEEEVGQAVASLKESRPRRGLDEEDRSRRLLLTAVQHDDAPVVLQFVADGAAAADMGEALRLAAGRGNASVVRELVAVGLSVNDGCRGADFRSLPKEIKSIKEPSRMAQLSLPMCYCCVLLFHALREMLNVNSRPCILPLTIIDGFSQLTWRYRLHPTSPSCSGWPRGSVRAAAGCLSRCAQTGGWDHCIEPCAEDGEYGSGGSD